MADAMRFGAWANGMDLYKVLSISIVKNKPIKVLQGPDVAGYAWKQIVNIADTYNKPGTVHDLSGLGMDLHAGLQEPASHRVLQGLEACVGYRVQFH